MAMQTWVQSPMGRAGLPWFHPVKRNVAHRPEVQKLSLTWTKFQAAFPLRGPGGLSKVGAECQALRCFKLVQLGEGVGSVAEIQHPRGFIETQVSQKINHEWERSSIS